MADESGSSSGELVSSDDISLNSSDSEQEAEYIVEKILAEHLSDDSRPRYLVKWEDYGEERCTWEPAESFLDPRSLRDWAKKRGAGIQLADDLVLNIDAKINAYKDTKALRKARRRKQRSRLAAKLSKPGKTTTSGSANASRQQQDMEEPIQRLLATNGQPVHSARRASTLNSKSSVSKLVDALPGAAATVHKAKISVFPGIDEQVVCRGTHHAHRTGNKRTAFRNLRHLNNVRKAARREPTPNEGMIKLRSPAEWAESAPKDTNVQLPASSPSLQDGGREAGVATGGSGTEASSQSQYTERLNCDLPQSRKPLSTLGGIGSSTSIGKKGTTTEMGIERETTLRTVASGRSFYHPCEFLAEIKFGKAYIGDIRIRGIPTWAIAQIIKAKGRGNLGLEIGANDVVTPAQWAKLCTGRSNVLQTTGIVIAYQDTADRVTEMENYLNQHTLAALWYHPTEDIMLVFYSPRSTAWMFLERMGGLHFDGSLRVLTRNKMPPTEMLAIEKEGPEHIAALVTDELPQRPSPQRTQPYSPFHVAEQNPINSDSLANDTVAFSASHSIHHSMALAPLSTGTKILASEKPWEQAISRSQNSQLSSSSVRTGQCDRPGLAVHPLLGNQSKDFHAHTVEQEENCFHLKLLPGCNIRDTFQKTFQISYSYLTTVPRARNVDRDPSKARFFLIFPQTAQAELKCLRKFLRSCTFNTNICTSMEERGWDAFQNIYKGDYVGVILFHEDCMHYHKLPRLASLLRSSCLNVFSVSLSRPLKYHENPCHISRLFPTGMAVLVTDATLIGDGVAILRWFNHKRRGPAWKLVLRPEIKSWLRHKASESTAEEKERFNDMLQELNLLSPGFSALRHRHRSDSESSSDAESIDGLSDGSGLPGPLFTPSIPGYDRLPPADEKGSHERSKDRALIDYFAGWSVAYADSHRKFVAVTPFGDSSYSKWGHIEVMKPEKFIQRERIGSERQSATRRS